MKIDLHVHSSERSACGQAGEDEQIKAAIASSLDAIVFTDHGKLVPETRLRELNHTYAPFRIFSGIEISLGEDILVFGIHDRELEQAQWTYLDLYSYVREQDGYMILAHPFRYHPYVNADIDLYPPDGIEIYSVNTPVSFQPHILELSHKLNITLYSNSDAHKTSSIGAYYNNIPGSPETDRELIQALSCGPVILK